MGRHFSLWLTAIGLTGLTAIAGAYWYTYEPAPGIRVTWGPDVSLEQQAALERKYLLSNRRSPHPDQPRSLAYDLLDTRRSNIEAMLKDPAVIDTNDIDDQWARVRLGTAYGDSWMWVADRTPVLRQHWVRTTIIAALSVAVALGLVGLMRSRPA